MLTGTAVRALSIQELLKALREKLDDECSRVQGISRSYKPSEKSVENEIESLETRARDILRFLPRLRNQLRPVNRLPPEVISHIAQWVLRIKDKFHVGPIIPLTHVCRYWRDSIVSAPENWTRIYNLEKGLAVLSLERAKTAPLDVNVMVIQDSEMEFLNLLRPHAHRVISLGCHGLSAIWDLTRAFPDFPGSMINLRSMSVSGRQTHRCDGDFLTDPFDFSTNTALRELTWSNLTLFPSVLGLKTLTEFNLYDTPFNLHVDTLLSFLGKNRSLERASLNIYFEDPSLYLSQRRHPVKTSLQELMIWCDYEEDDLPWLSNIALRKGGRLKIGDSSPGGLNRIISGRSVGHLPGLPSPTFMEYQLSPRNIQLVGPSGSFSYLSYLAPYDDPGLPFGVEFPLLSLTSIREVRLKCYGSWVPPQFQLSSFPSLEILAVDGYAMGGSDDDSLSEFNSLFGIVTSLSPVLPDPETSTSLKTLAFLDCAITEDFMTKLTRTAFERKIHNSPPLQRVVIMNSKGKFPSAGSIRWLEEYVAVVETLEGTELPKDLS